MVTKISLIAKKQSEILLVRITEASKQKSKRLIQNGYRKLMSTIAVRILTALAVLVLFWVIDWNEVVETTKSIDLRLLLPLFLFLASIRFLEAFQLQRAILLFQQCPTFVRAYQANALATFYGFILPGDLLSTIPKWLLLSANSSSKSDVLGAILYNRLVLITPPIICGFLAALFWSPFSQLVSRVPILILLIGLCVLFTLVAIPSSRNYFSMLLNKFAGDRLSSSNSIQSVYSTLEKLASTAPLDHLIICALGTVTTVLRIIGFICAAEILEIDAPWGSIAISYALIMVLNMFPITIGGIGIREGVLIGVLQISGVPATSAILLGLVMFADRIFFAMIGAVSHGSLSKHLINDYKQTS